MFIRVAALAFIATSTYAQTQAPTLAELTDRVARSVCTLHLRDEQGNVVGYGTGFLISASEIATNWHVAIEASMITAAFPGGASLEILSVVGRDKASDLAILPISNDQMSEVFGTDSKRAPLKLWPTLPKRGDEVFVVGSPRGLAGTLSTGVVSSVRPEDPIDQRLQITAPISPGSSGSPVFDMEGRVIGIVASSVRNSQAINFAIPTIALLSAERTPPLGLGEWRQREAPSTPAKPMPNSISPQQSVLFATRRLILEALQHELDRRISERKAKNAARFPPLPDSASELDKLSRRVEVDIAAVEQSTQAMFERVWAEAIAKLQGNTLPPFGFVAIREGWPFLIETRDVEALIGMWIPKNSRMDILLRLTEACPADQRTPATWWHIQLLSKSDPSLHEAYQHAKEMVAVSCLGGELAHAQILYEFRDYLATCGVYRIRSTAPSGPQVHALGGSDGLAIVESALRRNVVFNSLPELHSARAAILNGLANQRAFDARCDRIGVARAEATFEAMATLSPEDYASGRLLYLDAAGAYRTSIGLRRKRDEAAPPTNRRLIGSELISEEFALRRCLKAAGEYEQVVQLVESECSKEEADLKSYKEIMKGMKPSDRDDSGFELCFQMLLRSRVRLLEALDDIGDIERLKSALQAYQRVLLDRSRCIPESYRDRPTVRMEIQELEDQVATIVTKNGLR